MSVNSNTCFILALLFDIQSELLEHGNDNFDISGHINMIFFIYLVFH